MDLKIDKIGLAESTCIAFLKKYRWTDGIRCPYCRSSYISEMPKEARFHCNSCNTSFSATVRSIFHNSRLSLAKWFFAIFIIFSHKKIPVRHLAKALDLNKNTAWRISNRIQIAMGETEKRNLLTAIFEFTDMHIKNNFFSSEEK